MCEKRWLAAHYSPSWWWKSFDSKNLGEYVLPSLTSTRNWHHISLNYCFEEFAITYHHSYFLGTILDFTDSFFPPPILLLLCRYHLLLYQLQLKLSCLKTDLQLNLLEGDIIVANFFAQKSIYFTSQALENVQLCTRFLPCSEGA